MYSKAEVFAERTALHGVSDLFSSLQRKWKFLWALVLIAAICGAFYEIWMVIEGYMNTPLVTVFEIIAADKLTLPTLVLCPDQIINASKIAEHNIHPVILPFAFAPLYNSFRVMVMNYNARSLDNPLLANGPYSHDLIGYIIATSENQTAAVSRIISELESIGNVISASQAMGLYMQKKGALDLQYKNFLESLGLDSEGRTYTRNETGGDFEVLIHKIGLDPKQLFIGCRFMGSFLDCHKNLVPVYDLQLGMCYAIDTGAEQINPAFGIEIFIDLNLGTNLGNCLYTESSYALMPSTSDGLAISISDSYQPTVMKNIRARAGSQFKISLKATKYQMKSRGSAQNCREDINTTGNIVRFPYSDAACRAACFLEVPAAACGCQNSIHKAYRIDNSNSSNANACVSQVQSACIVGQIMNYFKDPEAIRCRSQCKPNCNYWEYTPTLSYSRFPSNMMREAYKKYEYGNGSVIERWRKNAIILDVSFEKIQYTSISQHESATIDQVGSEVGGYLGLFIGASIIALIQAIVICTCGDFMEKKQVTRVSSDPQTKDILGANENCTAESQNNDFGGKYATGPYSDVYNHLYNRRNHAHSQYQDTNIGIDRDQIYSFSPRTEFY